MIEKRIVILVTANDFNKFNPEIEPDDARIGLFARRLKSNIEAHLDSLPQRYHTAVFIENKPACETKEKPCDMCGGCKCRSYHRDFGKHSVECPSFTCPACTIRR